MASVLACDLQDHFEHACVLRLPVRLTLSDGLEIEGTAQDLTRKDGVEYLLLNAESGTQTVPLADVRVLKYPHKMGDENHDDKRWRVIHLPK